ncbi:MAG: two-component sensor histidine kinase [Paenibacillus sp.]|nr:two-component sensor histidine kinase [Paenibacillus sp.]
MVDEADQFIDANGKLLRNAGPEYGRFLDEQRTRHGLDSTPFVYFTDNEGNSVYGRPNNPPQELGAHFRQNAGLRNPEQQMKSIVIRQDEPYRMMIRTLSVGSELVGHVYYMLEEEKLTGNRSAIKLMLVMLGSATLLGWAVIYLLARRLVKPVQEVAQAAKQIVAGNYEVTWTTPVEGKEVQELQHSFQEMAARLSHLENLRNQLLAGVTHELKTPVTSISALVQAVNDGVVTGENAKQFLEICLKECGRLQKMIEDLLDFNSFAASSFQVVKERTNLNTLLLDIAAQSELSPSLSDCLPIRTQLPVVELFALTDPSRLQQVVSNLLNNSKAAMVATGTDGSINVSLYEKDGLVHIEVRDQGSGIPVDEQPFIFERFFRGAVKQKNVRGMGLGLPLSLMIMRSLGGDLKLLDSSPDGSVFLATLPRE